MKARQKEYLETRISNLNGKTIAKITEFEQPFGYTWGGFGDELSTKDFLNSFEFTLEDGTIYRALFEEFNTEEYFVKVSVTGDIKNIINSPVLIATEYETDKCCEYWYREDDYELYEEGYFIYRISTAKGTVFIKWELGSQCSVSSKIFLRKQS